MSQVHDVSTTVEGGGYVGYEYSHVGDVPFRLRGEVTVVTNAGSVYTGARTTLNTSAWLPLHSRVFIGGGLGATWVSGGFNETYYGVTSEDSQKSGLPAFNPGGGLNQPCKQIAPSTVLRKWYGHDPERFEEFTRRYREELTEPERAEALAHLRGLAKTGR